MQTSGAVVTNPPAPACPAVPDYKSLNAMVATVESDLIANTPDPRTDAFRNLENIRAILSSFAP